MNFVLCSDQTYQDIYRAEAHKWVRITECSDLLGYPKMHVAVHDCWTYNTHDDTAEYLEQQLTALADFGYIHLSFRSEDGWIEKYEYMATPTVELQEELVFKPTESVVAYETVDNSCDSGACAI